ncbi:MAG TPA: IS200/IS605 family transposase [Bacteroidales bacterium]|nr:IS200/IS605 family transposase [Bacteroidales bacterium]HPJ59397.1 IS200/IS605 family transposase [Bacteroidales bacterium]HPR12598.1 IS200/IS605 family transposase [Bacteroidales bacterium]HRW86089.1 IS200/IS605 family transposase [Bacteroidales bacterium]
MSFVSIWVHSVWTTKNRLPLLKEQIRDTIIAHILENAESKGIYIDHINGYTNHLHALISLGRTQSISEVMQKIKGESSFWINKNRLTTLRFEWQDDFWAASVGFDHIKYLRKYIKSQVSHHQNESVDNELDRLISLYGIKRIKD